jgi:GIY-YIG catalytic domain
VSVPTELDAESISAAITEAVPQSVGAPVPAEPGFYAWWADKARLTDAAPPIPPVHPPGGHPDWALLYVGIAPKRPSKASSDRTIAARVTKDHRGGNIGGSTFRQSLAVLLRESLRLEPKPGHDRPRLVDEKPLSDWIAASCALTVGVTAAPWRIESRVIGLTCAPLNLIPGCHEFRHLVRELREELRRDCL